MTTKTGSPHRHQCLFFTKNIQATVHEDQRYDYTQWCHTYNQGTGGKQIRSDTKLFGLTEKNGGTYRLGGGGSWGMKLLAKRLLVKES